MELDRAIQQARNEDKNTRQNRNGLGWEEWIQTKRTKRRQLQQVRQHKREALQKWEEEWMTSKAEEADWASERRHMGTVFQIIRELTQAKEHRRRFGHRRHDNPQDEAEAWKTHFALIQQGVGDIPDTIWSDITPLHGEFNWLDNPPTPEEVQRAINDMKMGKAPGPDMFMAEYL